MFDNIDLDVIGVIQAYTSAGLSLSANDLIGLDIKAGIGKTSIAAASQHPAVNVCFGLEWSDGVGSGPINKVSKGSKCTEQFAYLDQQVSGEQ